MSLLRIENLHTRTVGPVDLEIHAGECLCLSGKSGSGKSLLLRAIADLDPHTGEIYLDREACGAMEGPAWRRRVGMLAADSQWWAPTVGEHFGRPDPAGLHALGFGDEVMGWTVERMSSGERQRLALLRLLCNRPEVLLLDEPTANLDPAATRAVERLVADYRQRSRVAVLWVSHDPDQIRRVADRAMELVGGSLREMDACI